MGYRAGLPNGKIGRHADRCIAGDGGAKVRETGCGGADRGSADHADRDWPGRQDRTVLADALDPAHEPALVALNGKLEGRTEKLKNPRPRGSLAWLSWIVARLGGWSGYTSRGYKPAGPKTIARGLARLDGIIEGWALHSADVRLR